MEKLLMTGKTIVRSVVDSESEEYPVYNTIAELYLRKGNFLLFVFSVVLPGSEATEQVGIHLWDSIQPQTNIPWHEYAIMISGEEMILIVNLILQREGKRLNFEVYARLKGEIPDIIPQRAILDLTSDS